MIYLIFGKDSFRAKKKIKEIVERYIKIHRSGLNLKIFDLQEKKFAEFKEEIKTVAMFEEKKLFLLKNAHKNADFREKFLKEIKRISESKDIFIFFEETEVLKGEFWEKLKKIAKSAEFKPLDQKKLKIWTKTQFKKYQTEINPSALELLTEKVGDDLWQLEGEIKKLMAYCKEQTIQKKDVEEIVQSQTELDIFKVVETVVLGKRKEALIFLQKHREKGEKFNYLISTIKFQFKNILLVKDLIERGISLFEIKKILGLRPWVAEKYFFLSKRFELEKLKKIYENIFTLETKIKMGKIDVENALFSLFLSF